MASARPRLKIQQVVDDEAIQPGPELALAAKGRQLGDELEENFLRRVLGILRVEHHPERDVVDPALVPADEQLEGSGAPRLHEPDEIEILGIGGRRLGEWIRELHGRCWR